MSTAGAGYSFDEMTVGREAVQRYVITPAVYGAFLETFGDRSPIHVEPEAARRAGFADVLMHGAILNGFLSNFVGMHLPGGRFFELSAEISFLNPTYLNDAIQIRGRVAQVMDSQKVVVLLLEFSNVTRETRAAKARVQLKLREP